MTANNGVKIPLWEYTARKVLDVTAKAATPVITMATAYTLYFHGEEIADHFRQKAKARKIRKAQKH